MKTIKIKSDGGVRISFEDGELTLEVIKDGNIVKIEPLYPAPQDGTTTLPMMVHKSIIRGNEILVTGVSARLNREVKNEPPKQEAPEPPKNKREEVG